MKHLKIIAILCILSFAFSCGQQKKYINYKVKEGETIKSIAKNLDMATRDLLRLNPDVSRKPEANTVIVIPNKQITSTIKDTGVQEKTKSEIRKELKDSIAKVKEIKTKKELARDSIIALFSENFIVHQVKKGDTFYSLVRKYNVTSEEIIELNPILEEGLKTEQILKIKPLDEVFEEDNFLYKDTIQENISLKVAMLLPFKAVELDTLTSVEIFSRSRLANYITDFYLGAEVAIDSLRQQGVTIVTTVFDTERNSTKIEEIVATNNLNENDAIIGPFYSEEVNFLAANVDVPIVYPVYSDKQSTFSAKRIVKTSPNKKLYRNKLLEYIQEHFFDGNIVIVGDGMADSNYNTKQIEKILEANDSISNVSVILPENGYIDREKFIEVLQPETKNYIVVTTDDNVIVASAINGLISLPEETKVRVFTFDKVSAFNKIDNFKLAQIEFTYVSDEFSKEKSPYIEEFNKKYYHKNKALPTFYATKGFDITYDILMRLASGKELKSTFDEGFSYRLESKFDYTDKVFKVTENKGLFIVKYNEDLTLTRLK